MMKMKVFNVAEIEGDAVECVQFFKMLLPASIWYKLEEIAKQEEDDG